MKLRNKSNILLGRMEENDMRYADYDTKIMTCADLEKYKKYFQKDITDKQKELDDFIDRAAKRIEWIEECENSKKYSILGHTYKDGRKKGILLIIRYPDNTQRDEKYEFEKISELRKKLVELKEKHTGVDWSNFSEDLK